MTATTYLVLLRGINVGGRNKLPMGKLRQMLEAMEFEQVSTYLQSGNAILRSTLAARTVADRIEAKLTESFRLDSELIKVLALPRARLEAIVDKRPKGFGDEPDTYYSDAIFLMGIEPAEAMTAFSPLDGVDTLWSANGIIYFQRLGAKRTKSRLGRMMASPLYKQMTIRSWSTTLRLLELLKAAG